MGNRIYLRRGRGSANRGSRGHCIALYGIGLLHGESHEASRHLLSLIFAWAVWGTVWNSWSWGNRKRHFAICQLPLSRIARCPPTKFAWGSVQQTQQRQYTGWAPNTHGLGGCPCWRSGGYVFCLCLRRPFCWELGKTKREETVYKQRAYAC